MRPNSLLAKPPTHMFSHGLVSEPDTLFQRVTGRRIRREDWDGVHVTRDFLLALAYASGASDRHPGPAAVIGLQLQDIQLLPEIDGIAHLGSRLLDAREQWDHMSAQGRYPENALNALQPLEPATTLYEYTHPQAAYLNAVIDFLASAGVLDVFEDAFPIKQERDKHLAEFLRAGIIPDEVIIAGSSMARTLDDISEYQIQSITLLRPWGTWVSEDADASDWAYQQNLKHGYVPVDVEEALHNKWPAMALLHVAFRTSGKVTWWHGTSSKLARMALGRLWEETIGEPPSLTGQPPRWAAEGALGARVQQGYVKQGIYTPYALSRR